MNRKQCQDFWLCMTREAMDAGEKPGLLLDLSILVFADDATSTSAGVGIDGIGGSFGNGFPVAM
jgi:hypothetical protein